MGLWHNSASASIHKHIRDNFAGRCCGRGTATLEGSMSRDALALTKTSARVSERGVLSRSWPAGQSLSTLSAKHIRASITLNQCKLRSISELPKHANVVFRGRTFDSVTFVIRDMTQNSHQNEVPGFYINMNKTLLQTPEEHNAASHTQTETTHVLQSLG